MLQDKSLNLDQCFSFYLRRPFSPSAKNFLASSFLVARKRESNLSLNYILTNEEAIFWIASSVDFLLADNALDLKNLPFANLSPKIGNSINQPGTFFPSSATVQNNLDDRLASINLVTFFLSKFPLNLGTRKAHQSTWSPFSTFAFSSFRITEIRFLPSMMVVKGTSKVM